MQQAKWLAYCQLMRINRPIGTLLLLWPTLCALWLAKGGVPEPLLLFIFIVGVFLMRAAGCVVNDYADRHFDGKVKRTRQRPLATGQVTGKEARYLFLFLLILAFALVLLLNTLTICLSFVALTLAWIYPFMKRFMQVPQVILGMAFGWSIPMAFAASSNALPLTCWLLFLANICWTVVYDTLYAMVDRDDDLKIGIKSSAILFGRYDRLIIGVLQCCTLILLMFIGILNQLSGPYYWSLLLVTALFAHQQKLIVSREREVCFKAFMNNNYVGLLLFMGIAFGY